MKKISLALIGLSVILSGCATSENSEGTTTEEPSVVSSEQVSETAETESSEFIWPTDGEMTDDMASYEGHSGIDIVSGEGTDVVAAKAGTVVEAGFDELGKGYYVLLDNGSGYETLYGQLQAEPTLVAGDQVEQGQVIGQEGASGNATAEHLHFEVHKDGEVIDPLSVLPSK